MTMTYYDILRLYSLYDYDIYDKDILWLWLWLWHIVYGPSLGCFWIGHQAMQTIGAAPILFKFSIGQCRHTWAQYKETTGQRWIVASERNTESHRHRQNNGQTLHINMKLELIYQLTNNRPSLLPRFPKHRWCRPKTGRKKLSVGIACSPKLWMKLSKHHTLREIGLSFRTRKLRLRRSLQDLQRAKKNRDSLRYNVQTGQFSRPLVLCPFKNLYRSQRVWESALIGNPYQSAVLPFWWHCSEESKPSQAKELPRLPQKCRGHQVHSRGENGVGVTVCTNDTWQPGGLAVWSITWRLVDGEIYRKPMKIYVKLY